MNLALLGVDVEVRLGAGRGPRVGDGAALVGGCDGNDP